VPVLAHRVRKAARKGMKVALLNPQRFDYKFPIASYLVSATSRLVADLAAVVAAAAEAAGKSVPENVSATVRDAKVGDGHRAAAAALATGEHRAIWLGALAVRHPAYADLRALAATLAEITGASFGVMAEGGNAAGAYLAGAVPHREAGGKPAAKTGLSASEMLTVASVIGWIERKVIGWMRRGPNRVAFFGIFPGLAQPFADVFKLMFKEVIIPAEGERIPVPPGAHDHLIPAFAAWAVIPLSPGVVVQYRCGTVVPAGADLHGRVRRHPRRLGANSKYAFLGAMRSAAQIVAYEIAMGFAMVGVLMAAGSLNIGDIMQVSGRLFGWNWFWLFPLFVVYFISGVAETNRAPFDVAEGESEIVAGLPCRVFGHGLRAVLPRRIRQHDSDLGADRGVLLRRLAVALRGLGLARRTPGSRLRASSGWAEDQRLPCSCFCGSARHSRATATTRSCAWAGRR
jgi:hypothetical protein